MPTMYLNEYVMQYLHLSISILLLFIAKFMNIFCDITNLFEFKLNLRKFNFFLANIGLK